MNKAKLRKFYLAKRSSLSRRECSIASKRIAEHLFEYIDLGKLSLIHHFYPIHSRNEVDCLVIVKSIIESNTSIRTAAPRINLKTGELESIEIDQNTKFLSNEWGITEPVGEAFVDEREIDLILVPLLCFDKSGHRVGYGKGYYDRLLAKCRPDCLKIGLSYFDAVDDIEGIHDLDVRVDLCVTPSGVVEPEI